jgi:MATE family multidrug resistance protein
VAPLALRRASVGRYQARVSSSSTFGWGPLRIERARLRTITAIALPIVGGMVSQNLLNLIDTLMVSRLGKHALAAVGLASQLNFLSVAFIIGLSAGVQAMVARRKGEGREHETAVPLNGGLLLVLCIGVPLSIALVAAAPYMFPLLVDDPAVIAIGTEYYQMRLIAVVAVGANFAFRGFWNGMGMSWVYLWTLLVMHLSTIGISYLLIFGKLGLPVLGARGAGLGTSIGTFIGTATYFMLGWGRLRRSGFLRKIPAWDTMRSMLRLSVPSGAQQALFALGFTVMFVIIAKVGTNEAAAANVLLNITLVALLPSLGLGLAAASLVGQALGRGQPQDAARWGWDVSRVAVMICGALGLGLALFPELLLRRFLGEQPEVLAIAVTPLRLVGFAVAVDAVGMVLLNAMMGAGATFLALVVSTVMQWVLFLPAAYLVGPVMGFGLIGVWLAQIGYRMLQTGVLVALWRSGRWSRIRV